HARAGHAGPRRRRGGARAGDGARVSTSTGADTAAAAYDIVIVDCPPAFGLLTLNALAAATDVLVPVQCEYLALEGLTQLAQTLAAVKRNLNPGLELGGLVLTMYDSRTNLAQQVADEVRSHFPATFKTV